VTTPASSALKRVLGLDYGSRRIGVAISDPLRIIARGLCVLQNSPAILDELRSLVHQHDVGEIVVGMPLTLKGVKGAKALEVEEFTTMIREGLGLPVHTLDERFTSRIAQETIRSMGVKKSQRQVKESVDAAAAALVLQQFLDRRGT
jgi:putative Holliday junction resolvase